MSGVEIAVEVDKLASETQDYINSFYDVFAKRVFNLDTHRFQIKKELITKAGFWVAKKRYCQNVILDNGIEVNKFDVKGLDIVRSSFPESFKEIMTEVLELILDGTPQSGIDPVIKTYKSEFYQKTPSQIAKVAANHTGAKYKTKDPFVFKKGTPAHTKAMLAYNDLLKHFECPYKFESISGETKYKWVYLKQNPYGLDGLAFKDDNDPPEIMNLIHEYLDYDKMIESELLGKLQDFYDVMGWNKLLSTTSTASKFFSFN